MTEDIVYGVADDPVLGKFVANYPGNRLRLLLIGGGILVLVWLITTVLLWQVDGGLAATITVIVLAIATWVVGWYMAHLWNREVVLYEHGFSYREGSNIAFLKFDDVVTFRQKAERRSFFGGLIHHNFYQLIILTRQNERIILTEFYNRIEELSIRIDHHITETLLPRIQERFTAGERVPFSEGLSLGAEGLYVDSRHLPWVDFGEHKVANRQLSIITNDGQTWYSVPLAEIDNLRLLLNLFQQNKTEDVSS